MECPETTANNRQLAIGRPFTAGGWRQPSAVRGVMGALGVTIVCVTNRAFLPGRCWFVFLVWKDQDCRRCSTRQRLAVNPYYQPHRCPVFAKTRGSSGNAHLSEHVEKPPDGRVRRRKRQPAGRVAQGREIRSNSSLVMPDDDRSHPQEDVRDGAAILNAELRKHKTEHHVHGYLQSGPVVVCQPWHEKHWHDSRITQHCSPRHRARGGAGLPSLQKRVVQA